jgi:protein phosphatase
MDRNHSHWDKFLEHAALSDVGLRRANNQDSMAVAMAGSRHRWLERGHLFVVADGMGAHAAGELASKIATDVVPLTYHKLRDRSPPDALLAAVEDANGRIYDRGQASDDFKGMGTTVCALALTVQGALVGHVGDSRVYRWRDHRLEQLTFDHSLLWEMRAAGQLPEEDSAAFVPKNIITRSLGPHSNVRVDLEGPFPIQVGDVYVLCSDGLSGPVENDEIGKIVGCMPPEQAARALVDLANLRGGPDNITVIVIRIVGEPQLPQPDGSDPPDEEPPRRPVHPFILGITGLLALGALVLGFLGNWPAAAGSFVGALILVGVAIIQRAARGRVGYEFENRLLGQGPHSEVDCRPDAAFADKLSQIVQQLRNAATYGDWNVDWSRFNRHRAQAEAASQSGDYPSAISEYCLAMSCMVRELKAQRGRK